jgi:hypothetical protein
MPESEGFVFKKKQADTRPKTERSVRPAAVQRDINRDLGLVGVAGHYLWTYLSSRRLYIYVTTGYSSDDRFCAMYCMIMLVGFVFLPRELMLLIGLFTAAIGPSLVLFILGIAGGSIACMAFSLCTQWQ